MGKKYIWMVTLGSLELFNIFNEILEFIEIFLASLKKCVHAFNVKQ